MPIVRVELGLPVVTAPVRLSNEVTTVGNVTVKTELTILNPELRVIGPPTAPIELTTVRGDQCVAVPSTPRTSPAVGGVPTFTGRVPKLMLLPNV